MNYYVKLFRKIVYNPVLRQSAVHMAIFILLLLIAAQGDYDVGVIHLVAGQALVDEWRFFYINPSKNVIDNALYDMKKAGMIDYKINQEGVYIITIINWMNYQQMELEEINKTSGYIKLYSSIVEREQIMYSPQRLVIWVMLLLRANIKTKKVLFKNKIKTLLPGECTLGSIEMSEKFPVASSTIRKTLKLFAQYGMIEYETSRQKTWVRIVKWQSYQKPHKSSDEQCVNDVATTEQCEGNNIAISDDNNANDMTMNQQNSATDNNVYIANDNNLNNNTNNDNYIDNNNILSTEDDGLFKEENHESLIMEIINITGMPNTRVSQINTSNNIRHWIDDYKVDRESILDAAQLAGRKAYSNWLSYMDSVLRNNSSSADKQDGSYEVIDRSLYKDNDFERLFEEASDDE